MTKQAELKKQAYESNLKSRALSVLIYLIDRSNKDLTCFPAIPTMAQQLHISISTVKRALSELVEAGFVEKDTRFREKNKGQTSNLYTLVRNSSDTPSKKVLNFQSLYSLHMLTVVSKQKAFLNFVDNCGHQKIQMNNLSQKPVG